MGRVGGPPSLFFVIAAGRVSLLKEALDGYLHRRAMSPRVRGVIPRRRIRVPSQHRLRRRS